MTTLFDGETPVTDDLVRSLVDDQCPRWRALELSPMTTSGTEHRTFRLGTDLLVRVPRNDDAETGLRKEIDWLPRLQGRLPLEIPVIEHVGSPSEDYPHAWTVNRWIAGEDASARVLSGEVPLGWADTVAETLAALRSFGLGEVPAEDWPQGSRGGHLRDRAEGLDQPDDAVSGPVAPERVRAVVDDALAAGTPDSTPVLLHADLIPGNLVARGDELVGLLDFGTLTTGYAATDLSPAWWVLDRAGRARLRSLLEVDDVSWAWGRAFAAIQGHLAHWIYAPRGHALAPLGDRAVAEVLSDSPERD
ncbi:aminoglycoside phosphotransferase (APT) family kinase protein [Knoellia remsis]|uniref:Aminoglycoside phosphotransferase (APT) family kinase protein n=1 Tax=Knoellia remsis TaxID=407159 RepID=A0A2T0V127_9MICO|nr:aminoglycoside phosphotransferase family protein [Knoellia remsis]PRY63807.1 aminoglycoside phosphotransferase (APT) family kinase protein [Knoellia remsis]